MYESFVNKHPDTMAGMNLMGTFFYWFFLALNQPGEPGRRGSSFSFLAATTLVAAVQAFVAGTAAHHDMAAYITGRGIALHALGCCIQCVQ